MASSRSISEIQKFAPPFAVSAINQMLGRDQASHFKDSGHAENPILIFDFPHVQAKIGLRWAIDGKTLSLYIRDETLNEKKLSTLLPERLIKKRYGDNDSIAGSIGRSKYLTPSEQNPVLLLTLKLNELESVLNYWFGLNTVTEQKSSVVEIAETTQAVAQMTETEQAEPRLAQEPAAESGTTSQTSPITTISAFDEPAEAVSCKSTRVVSAQDFEEQLECNSMTGNTGEEIAMLDEESRLLALGCPDPKSWVSRVALEDVGRGYDIESTWPGQERLIEVKTTTSANTGFFITRNERNVLSGLGKQAWLYRVVLDSQGEGQVVFRLQDPIAAIGGHALVPVLFQVSARALENAATV